MSKDRTPVNEDGRYAALDRYAGIVPGAWEAFQEHLRSPPPVTVWRNAARIGHEEFCAWLQEYEQVEAHAQRWDTRIYRLGSAEAERVSPGNLLAYGAGLYHVQEESAAVPATILAPEPGDDVLDMCAAPGNKSAQIAQMVGDEGTVLANDVSERRIQAGIPTWERLGFLNIAAAVYDAGNLPRMDGAFDRVLLDAPCSGEGTCRRNPSALRRSSARFHRHILQTQARLLERSIDLCKPGGHILYCTCTFAPEENEEQLDRLLRGPLGGSLDIVPIKLNELQLSAGITEWEGRRLHPDLAATVRIWPHLNNTGGFFMALLRRRSTGYAGASSRPPERSDTLPATGSRPAAGSQSQWPTASCRPADAPSEPADASSEPALPGFLEETAAHPFVSFIGDRFGIDTNALLTHYRFAVSGGRSLVMFPHRLPPAPEIVLRALGMRLLRIGMATPKPTSEAVPVLGHRALRNILEVDAYEMSAVRRHEPFSVDSSRILGYTGPGFLIVVFRDVPTALVSAVAQTGTADRGDHSGVSPTRVLLQSWYPRRRLGNAPQGQPRS